MKEVFAPQAKLLHHSDRVGEWIRTGHTTPILFEVAPTGYCNAACPWCLFKGKRSSARVDKKLMLKAIEDMAKMDVKALNWSGGGEPTLHPDFEYFVDYASRHGLKQGLFTNGYNIIPHQTLFSWIRISLTDKGYDKIKKPDVPFGICVNQLSTYREMDLRRLCVKARNIGARYFQIRPALIGSYKDQISMSPPKYLEKLRKKNFDVYITDYKYEESKKAKVYKDCYGYHFCPSIGWNGKVNVCLYLTLQAKYQIGDLKKDRLIDIWPRITKRIKVTKECQNCCKNNEINKLLYAAKNIREVDFI